MSPVPQWVVHALGRSVSFRARVVLVVLATTTAFALFVVDRSSRHLRETYTRAGQTEALSVARSFDAEVAPADMRDRRSVAGRLDRLKAGNPGLRKVSLYVIGRDGRGVRIASTARAEIGRAVGDHDVAPIRTGGRRLEDLRAGNGHLVELNYPLRAGRARPFAALGVYFDMATLDAAYARRRRNLLLVGLAAAVAAATLVALVLGLLVFRPIAKLRAATQRIGAGDLTGRLNWKRSDELGALARDVDQMASAVEERERFESLARKDPLTGLANHRHFDEVLETELEVAGAEGTSVALGVLDLDHFKEINDVHGHPFGDEVLRRAAEALRCRVRSRDVVARLGGEEFGVILPGCDMAAGIEVIENARRALAGISAGERMLSASAGVAAFPDDARDGATLVELADGALYWAKRSGRGVTRRYDPRHVSGPSSGEDVVELESLLEEPAGIAPVFQPIVDLATGAVVGYESLARFAQWAPQRDPRAWLARAQRFGKRERMEARALRVALEQPGRPPGTFLSVNLSPSAVCSPEIVAALPDELSDLVIEMTEEEILLSGAAGHRAVEDLRRRGARVAIDDVGAGYAGLKEIATVQPDIVKLDGALVDGVHGDPARGALIECLVTFADRTGAKLCAKAIESLDDLRAVAQARVSYGQGYALASPEAGWGAVSPEASAALGALRGTPVSDPTLAAPSPRRGVAPA
jgi:diguanylate cyclase (GGDEF)-like protein